MGVSRTTDWGVRRTEAAVGAARAGVQPSGGARGWAEAQANSGRGAHRNSNGSEAAVAGNRLHSDQSVPGCQPSACTRHIGQCSVAICAPSADASPAAAGAVQTTDQGEDACCTWASMRDNVGSSATTTSSARAMRVKRVLLQRRQTMPGSVAMHTLPAGAWRTAQSRPAPPTPKAGGASACGPIRLLDKGSGSDLILISFGGGRPPRVRPCRSSSTTRVATAA